MIGDVMSCLYFLTVTHNSLYSSAYKLKVVFLCVMPAGASINVCSLLIIDSKLKHDMNSIKIFYIISVDTRTGYEQKIYQHLK